MKLAKCLVFALGLLGLGCRWPWEPKIGPVVGVVRYSDGAPVYMAKVWIVNGGSTFTDMLGHYRLPVRAAAGDTVAVVATDGYTPGTVYGETRHGSARIAAHPSAMVRDIVLDHSTPI